MRCPSPPLPPVTRATAPLRSIRSSLPYPLFPVKRCWRPIRGAPGQPVAGCLAIVIDRIGLPGKGGPVVEAIRVDDGAGARSRLADRADIDAAALADQELGSAGAKAVALDQGPVRGVDVDRPVGIAGGPRIVGAAERTAAGAQPRLRRHLRQAQAEAKIAAVTAAAVFGQMFAQPRSPVGAAITPASARPAISAAAKPASPSTSALCSPMRGGWRRMPGRRRSVPNSIGRAGRPAILPSPPPKREMNTSTRPPVARRCGSVNRSPGWPTGAHDTLA